MVRATVPTDLGLYIDENDPTEAGDIKIVRPSSITVIDDCESTTQWSVLSGAGVTIFLSTTNPRQGAGCIAVQCPAGVTALVQVQKTSGSWDLSVSKYLRFSVRQYSYSTTVSAGNIWVLFGESVYNEQGPYNAGPIGPRGGPWVDKAWDISPISPSSRDAVTKVAFTFTMSTSGAGGTGLVFIDYVYAEVGTAEVKAFDGNSLIRLFPKVYHGSYTGNGSSLIIPIPRKGTPSYIEIQRAAATNAQCIYWHTAMGSGNCLSKSATGSFITNAITAVSDGNFTVGSNAHVNTSGSVHYFTVMWED